MVGDGRVRPLAALVDDGAAIVNYIIAEPSLAADIIVVADTSDPFERDGFDALQRVPLG